MRLSRAVLAVLLSLSAACAGKDKPLIQPGSHSDVSIYAFDPDSSIESRIKEIPRSVLEHYRQEDRRPDYLPYIPTPAERAMVMEYLLLMPPSVQRIFRERCVGLWFVDNLVGNGLTGWVGGKPGEIYFFMALNPAVLRKSLSETLTERERSCFIPESGFDVRVDAGKKYKGLAYALFHEAAHAADYVMGVTPFTEPGIPKEYSPLVRPDGGLFTETWEAYDKPLPRNDFYSRDKITFYGFSGGPKLPVTEAAGLHLQLAKSPFVSLYGAKSWAEDFSELVAFGMIAGRLGQPYRVTLTGPGGRSASAEHFEGLRSQRAMKALELLEKIP